MSDVICDYCGQPAALVGGRSVYPSRPDLAHRKFWLCLGDCDAYVGCHPGTERPLGRLANPELRHWKKAAHAAFDPIWQRRFIEKSRQDEKYKKGMARGGRYKALAGLLGIPKEACHIGMFNVELCKRTIELCRSGALEE